MAEYDADTFVGALALNLRKPDCEHEHMSFPDADVLTILRIIAMHPQEVVDYLVKHGKLIDMNGEACIDCGISYLKGTGNDPRHGHPAGCQRFTPVYAVAKDGRATVELAKDG